LGGADRPDRRRPGRHRRVPRMVTPNGPKNLMPPDPHNLPPVDPHEQVHEQLVHTLPPLPPAVVNELLRRFTYHRPNVDQAQRYELITAETRDLAGLICQLCPDSTDA